MKPGFVETEMTANMDLDRRLTAQPEDVARDIYDAQDSMKDLVYTKWIWKLIMACINIIPEHRYKKTDL